MTFLIQLLLVSLPAFSLPVKIEKNLVIRSIEKNRAVQKGAYVLKAGSIIEIPDEYVVRDSIGGIDLTATLLNWRMSDSQNGIYSIVDANNRVTGKDAFFQLRILQAAPGSVLPKNQISYVALDFLARTRSMAVIEDNLSVTTKPESDVPVPTPRPPQEWDSPAEKPRHQEPISPPLIGSGPASGTGPGSSGVQPPPPSTPSPPPSKQDILNLDTDTGAPGKPDIKVYEKAPSDYVPTPTPRPEYNAAQVIADASKNLPGAGTPEAVCPSGDCGVTVSGTDEENKLVCEQIAKGEFPGSLNSVRLTRDGQKIVDASLTWISRSLKNPNHCKNGCSFPKGGIIARLTSPQNLLNTYCAFINNCSSRCKTSDIQTSWTCTADSKKRAKECQQTCSPYLNVDMTHRKDHIKRVWDRISAEIEQNNPNYAKRMKDNKIFDNMDQRLLCLNLRRENVDLDPMARNCSSTAIGIGQVLVGTFYYGLGLANKTQQKNCLNFKLSELSSKCRGWDKNAFRKEIYSKYMDYTPKELYEMRTLDVELQARSTYATFLDKLRLTGFNLNKAYRSYFGKSDQNAINRIENCVRTGK